MEGIMKPRFIEVKSHRLQSVGRTILIGRKFAEEYAQRRRSGLAGTVAASRNLTGDMP